ncbi:hypothetical protein [Gracilibacillus sp. YIM 98692]|uniref:hypothetical protein n=1 Tax=Gracilibacillus sp. YIM 98692 TaxID=2663532 RepID=UPI0013D4B2AE|nr:hypothetical protein [Gracilibacillus sp. YIM 98692]
MEKVDVNDTFQDIEQDIDRLKNIEESIYEFTDKHQIEDNYLNIQQENPLSKYHTKRNTVQYMVATAMLDEVDFFIESFLVEQFSKDLFSFDNTDKEEVVKNMMNAITRNKTLSAIGYKAHKGEFGTETNTVDVVFQYEDGLEVEMEISFQAIKGGHHREEDATHAIHVIETSVLDVMESIEKHENE